jgi:hypothetical protein
MASLIKWSLVIGASYASIRAGLWKDGYNSRKILKNGVGKEIEYTKLNDVNQYLSSVMSVSNQSSTTYSLGRYLSSYWNNCVSKTFTFLSEKPLDQLYSNISKKYINPKTN